LDLALESYRYRAFEWHRGLAWPYKLALALLGAGLIGLAAQVRVYLPWTPVPVTGQTFAVLLTAVLLGRHWGGITAGLYAALGAAGLPWFAGGAAGWAALAAPSGGYVLGFVLAALFLGHVSDRYVRARSWYGLVALMAVADFVFLFGPGMVWLALTTGVSDLWQVLCLGLLPFIPGELVKIPAAAAAAFALTPRKGSW